MLVTDHAQVKLFLCKLAQNVLQYWSPVYCCFCCCSHSALNCEKKINPTYLLTYLLIDRTICDVSIMSIRWKPFNRSSGSVNWERVFFYLWIAIAFSYDLFVSNLFISAVSSLKREKERNFLLQIWSWLNTAIGTFSSKIIILTT